MVSLLDTYPRSMGCPNQNFVAFNQQQRDDYVKRHIKVSDVYTSVYAFAECDENHRVIHDSAIIDRIFFDFDPDNTDNWFKDLMKVHFWCEKYKILHWNQFSGNGGHSFIFCKNVQFKKEAVGNFQRWLQQQLDINMDRKVIGDIGRIFRYPNTYNFKGRRFAIPIPNSVLNHDLSEEWLWRHSTKQLYENAWSGQKLLNMERWDVQEFQYMDFDVAEINLNQIDPCIAIDYNQFPDCIKQWMSTPDLTDEIKFLLSVFLKDQLYTPIPFNAQEIISILKRTLSDGEFNHWFGRSRGNLQRRHYGHNGIKFRSAMSRDYYLPTCVELDKKGLCPKDCGRRHPIYD
jgi:hypothetical protein